MEARFTLVYPQLSGGCGGAGAIVSGIEGAHDPSRIDAEMNFPWEKYCQGEEKKACRIFLNFFSLCDLVFKTS